MRKTMIWVGSGLCAIGGAAIVASGAMRYLGYEPSYNFGDPTKFEFVLVPFWQIGLAIAVLGGLCVLIARRAGAARD
jgi:hypothetical protein